MSSLHVLTPPALTFAYVVVLRSRGSYMVIYSTGYIFFARTARWLMNFQIGCVWLLNKIIWKRMT